MSIENKNNLQPIDYMEAMKPIIGILGGMGPRATVAFEGMLLYKLPGTDQELPTIFTVNDGSIPDRTKFLLGEGADPVPHLLKNLGLLEQVGVNVVCIPCNTCFAPTIIDRIQSETSLPIISLPTEVGNEIKRLKLQSVFLLATEGTLRSNVYQNICSEIDVECIEPDDAVRGMTTEVIDAVKNNNMAHASTVALEIMRAIQESKTEGVILGCTELPLVTSSLVPEGCMPIDTLDILAQAAIGYLS